MSRLPAQFSFGWPRRAVLASAIAVAAVLPLAAAVPAGAATRDATPAVASPWASFTLTRASLTAGGGQADGASFFASIAGNGGHVVFRTNARNVWPDAMTVVRDRATGRLTPVTLTKDGKPSGFGQVIRSSISADGRYVAFCSMANDLVPGQPPYEFAIRVFVRDTRTGTTVLASVDENGRQFTYDSAPPVLSADGRSVAFISGGQVYVRDLAAGRTVKASVPPAGENWWYGSSWGFPSLSADGRKVAFARNPGGGSDVVVYVRDLVAGTTVPASVNRNGATVYAVSDSPALSADGRYVTFASTAPDIVPGDAGPKTQVYRRDLATRRNVRISVSPAGAPGNEGSLGATISGNGRYVAFVSLADNLVAGDTDALRDVFVRDVDAGTTTRVSVTADGNPPDQVSQYLQAVIADNGRSVLFQSSATNLVPYDTNGAEDVFVADVR